MSALDSLIIDRVPPLYPSRWLQGYARGKLGTDPVYRASFDLIGTSDLPLLDVGCGMGLHAFYLRERGYVAPILGIDVDERKIIAAQRAIAEARYQNVSVQLGDGAHLPSFSGHVAMLDVLHYFAAEDQPEVLTEMASRVAPGGWCIIRTSPRDGTWRFRMTQLEEMVVAGISWMSRPAISFPTISSIRSAFCADQFAHEIRPLWGRTPFNSWLLAFQRRH